MKFTLLQYTWQKVLAVVLTVFLFIITVVAYFVNRHWSPILAAQVRNTVLASTDSLYQANFTDADLHVVQGKLVIHNLTLKPDQHIYRKRLKQGTAPNNLYTLKVKRIVFKHIHPIKLYFHRKLDISQVVLSAPELQISYQLNHFKDHSLKNNQTVWYRIKGMLKSVQIGKVMLNDVKLMYKDYSGNQLNISELKEMNLLGKNLLIDSVTQTDSTRFLYFKDVQAELNNFGDTTKNGLYAYNVKRLWYSTQKRQLIAHQFKLAPMHDTVLAKRQVRTWFAFDADTITLSRFDFKKFNKYRFIQASHLLLSRSNLTVFANPNGKPKPGNRLVTYPNVAIHQLKNQFTIDTVELHRIHITYKGYGKRSHKQGLVSYNNTSGYIYNLTNQPLALQKNNITRIQLNSYLMDSGPLKATFTFNLTDSAHSFTYAGQIGPMNLEKLNKATMPFGLLKITSGQLDELKFNFKGNRRQTTGNVSFLYHNLKIRILKADTVADRYRRRAIASILANALVVKHNNPDKPGDVARSFNVTYIRQPDTPFFKTVWKGLAMGLKASAGYDAATEKMVKQHIAQHRADQQRRQANREMRRRKRALQK